MANTAEKNKVTPLLPAEVGLIEHKVVRLNATIPANLKDELENHEMWSSVASKFTMGAEVRCIADDMSFVAYGICTFVQGSNVKIKIITFHDLDEVDQEVMADQADDFEAKLCGSKKWCVIKKSTGEKIKEGIATQLDAMRELEDYRRALRA